MQQTLQLGAYRAIGDYTPRVADFVIWQGVFRSWFGVVGDFDAASGIVFIITEGSPRLLFTQTAEEMSTSTFEFTLQQMRTPPTGLLDLWRRGSFYVQQIEGGATIWYV